MKKELLIWILMILSMIVIGIQLISDLNNNFFIILLNLSYSYFAAFLFYIGQVFIPTVKNQKKALIFAQPYLHNISKKMKFLLDFTDAIFKITDGELKILGDDNGYIYYQNGNTKMFENYKEYFKEFKNSIKNEIVLLKKNNLYGSLPDDLLDILSNIEMEEYHNIVNVGKLYPICRLYTSLESELDVIRNYLNKLKKYDKEIDNNTIVLLNDEEREKYKENISKYEDITKMLQKKIR